ncbi:cytochrome P450 [Cubamyces lactineus]|nr:cytochrome P450 [Cubamyces lactineus]
MGSLDFAWYYYLGGLLLAIYFAKWFFDPLRAIPTVGGPSLPLLSYLGSARWIRHGRDMLQEGYDKYHGSAFKVAMLDQWLVVISGSKLIEDVGKRPDHELSFHEAAGEFVQTKYTVGHEAHHDPYHVNVVREKLTRNLSAILPEIMDELTAAVHENIPAEEDEWLGVDVMGAALQIVARASNRVFVGLPTCRFQRLANYSASLTEGPYIPSGHNRKYLDLAIGVTSDVNRDRTTISMFPSFMKPFIGRIFGSSARNMRRAIPILKPMMDERRRMMEKYGDDWPDKPNDMIQWVMDEGLSRNNTDEEMVQRVLLVNFAAIHTSSNSITHAIYHLAERPEYLISLREEIEPIIQEEGWTKNAISRMWKLDSFIRESQRLNGINTVSLMRKAQQDVALCDGTLIPRGTLMVAAAHSLHHDDSVYADADVFDPWRFSRQREREGEAKKHQYVNTSVDYIPFGHGKHACPGRFFAANELKAMLAYIALNFDMKLDGDGRRPENIYWGPTVIPSPDARVLFRKRQASTRGRVA